MNNFTYHIPTKVYFGEGQISNLATAVKEAGGSHVLLVYGGGSIKKIGLYDEVYRLLGEAGIKVSEISGVEPNPRVTTVAKGRDICREQGCDLVLAVGGGSTIDCSKVIAATVAYEGDPWELVLDSSKITTVLPVVAVLTLSATGSEMNGGAVISNMDTNDKNGVGSPLMRPKASILDPTYTYSVSPYQTASGTIDIMSHVLESYFTRVTDSYLQDRVCEGLLKCCIHYGPIALAEPENYEARSNLMWASSWGINDFIRYGKGCPWTIHPMEHQLSAYYDITHGIGLAILTPHWMRLALSDKTEQKFYEYGVNVWGIDANLPKNQVANMAIDATADFFKSLGSPMTLREVGIDDSKLELMAEKAAHPGLMEAYIPMGKAEVLAVYQAALE